VFFVLFRFILHFILLWMNNLQFFLSIIWFLFIFTL